jgi:integrase/recombinase XerC
MLFLEKNRGRAKLTAQTYRPILEAAAGMLIMDEKKKIIDLMPFREAIAGESPKTISKKLSAIRSFFAFLKERGDDFHVINCDSVRTPKSLPKPVPHKRIEEALNTGGEGAFIVYCFYALGIRIGEAAKLKLTDIANSFIRVTGKGNRSREIPVFDDLREKIERFIALTNPKTYLFEDNGKPLSENQLRYRIVKSFERVGLKVTPHQLRHSFATETLNHGARIADISEILGHSQLSTTEIYTKLSSSAKLKSYIAAHPLCDRKTDA